jgi:hypothetical protein
MSRADAETVNRERADADIQDCVECVPPADAFALVGNETRLSILEALWSAETEPVSFSALHEAVGLRDSAQFNYHLGELTDQYVRKTDDGYALRTAGAKVVRAILAGSFTEHPQLDAFPVGDDCTRCGEGLVARYADGMLAIDCPDCGRKHGEYSFPPGGLHDRTRAEILSAFDQRVRHLHCLAKDGVCPECSGRMHTSISREGECCLGVGLRADHVCEQCRHELCSAIGLSLLDQSAVVAFHRDHGVDLGTTPYWRLDWCVSDDATAVRSTDPWEIEVAIELDGETLWATLDGDLTLVDAERTDA